VTNSAKPPSFEEAAAAASSALGASGLREVAALLSDGWPDQALLGSVRDREAAAPLLASRAREGVPAAEAAAFLRGLAAGHAAATGGVSVETVWTGPSSHSVPVRSTAQALLEVVDEAREELVLMTYSARRRADIREALTRAVERGVSVSVVVETLAGAGGAISGEEPGQAFAGIGGVRLWHWPADRREGRGAKAHAKLAVADRRALLVSSANLTQSGVATNMEAGLLVRGGATPRRVAEHVVELRVRGVLAPMSEGGR
jgi:phosphatidylserine/phosphatidylglycerophosphate/cardiolipin synthase-like enzyme